MEKDLFREYRHFSRPIFFTRTVRLASGGGANRTKAEATVVATGVTYSLAAPFRAPRPNTAPRVGRPLAAIVIAAMIPWISAAML